MHGQFLNKYSIYIYNILFRVILILVLTWEFFKTTSCVVHLASAKLRFVWAFAKLRVYEEVKVEACLSY